MKRCDLYINHLQRLDGEAFPRGVDVCLGDGTERTLSQRLGLVVPRPAARQELRRIEERVRVVRAPGSSHEPLVEVTLHPGRVEKREDRGLGAGQWRCWCFWRCCWCCRILG